MIPEGQSPKGIVGLVTLYPVPSQLTFSTEADQASSRAAQWRNPLFYREPLPSNTHFPQRKWMTNQNFASICNKIVLRRAAFFVHHHLCDLRHRERPSISLSVNSNKVTRTRSQQMIAKSPNTLLPALAFTILAFTLASPPQTAAQIIDKVNKNLYSETANPTADIAAALAQARREHKRVILDFGGNWCGDCQVLDIYYRQSPNAELLAKNFILVHINIGHMDKNVDVAKKYHVPITKGVPALAVIDANGNLLYSEREKEFEHTSPAAITAFLNRWKPVTNAAPLKKVVREGSTP
jgi:thiol-disulfide isomerase/thioredoxin